MFCYVSKAELRHYRNMVMYTCICVKLTTPVALTSSNDLLKAFNAPAGKLTKLTLTKRQAVTAHLTGSCQTTCYNLHPLTQGDLKLSTSESRLHSLQLCNAHMIMMLAKSPKVGQWAIFSREEGEETFRVLHLTCYRPDLWIVCQHKFI